MLRSTSCFIYPIALIFTIFCSAARATEVDCDADQLKTANHAVEIASAALDQAIDQLGHPDSKVADLLQLWFGVASAPVVNKIRDHLTSSRAYLNGINFRCANSTDINIGDVYAYVDADKAFRIVLSSWFFNQPDDGSYLSRPGIIIHEMTHFFLTSGTGDAEGAGDWITICKQLALNDPDKAQATAYNHEFFVEALYFGL